MEIDSKKSYKSNKNYSNYKISEKGKTYCLNYGKSENFIS